MDILFISLYVCTMVHPFDYILGYIVHKLVIIIISMSVALATKHVVKETNLIRLR